MDYGGLAMLAFMALYGLVALLRHGRLEVSSGGVSEECRVLLNLATSVAQERGDPQVGVEHLAAVASVSVAMVPLVQSRSISLDSLRRAAVASLAPQGVPSQERPPLSAQLEELLVHAVELGQQRGGTGSEQLPPSPKSNLCDLKDLVSAMADRASGAMQSWAVQMVRPPRDMSLHQSGDETSCIYLVNNDVISIDDALRLLRMELELDVDESLLVLFCAQVRGVAALGPYPRRLARARCDAVARLASELGVSLELTTEAPDTSGWRSGPGGMLPPKQ